MGFILPVRYCIDCETQNCDDHYKCQQCAQDGHLWLHLKEINHTHTYSFKN